VKGQTGGLAQIEILAISLFTLTLPAAAASQNLFEETGVPFDR